MFVLQDYMFVLQDYMFVQQDYMFVILIDNQIVYQPLDFKPKMTKSYFRANAVSRVVDPDQYFAKKRSDPYFRNSI